MRYHPLYDGLWNSPKLEGASFEEKGFFVFLFGNDRQRPSGIYRATDAQLAGDTGLPMKTVRAYLTDLSSRGRIVRDGQWLLVVGYFERQPKQSFLLRGAKADVDACESVPILRAWGQRYQHYKQWSADRLATIGQRLPEGPSATASATTVAGTTPDADADTEGPSADGRSAPQGASGGFDAFWQLLPKSRKVNKPDARKAWAKLKPNAALTEKILGALKNQLASPYLAREDFRYFPHPHRWLAKLRWEDEVMQMRNGAPSEAHSCYVCHQEHASRENADACLRSHGWGTLYDCGGCDRGCHETLDERDECRAQHGLKALPR